MAWVTNGSTKHNKSLKNFYYGLGDQWEYNLGTNEKIYNIISDSCSICHGEIYIET